MEQNLLQVMNMLNKQTAKLNKHQEETSMQREPNKLTRTRRLNKRTDTGMHNNPGLTRRLNKRKAQQGEVG